MSSNPYNTKKFKALFKKWNRILAVSGHTEIEDFDYEVPDRTAQDYVPQKHYDKPTFRDEARIDSNYIPLKRWEASMFRRVDPDLFAAKQEYFHRAEALLDTFKFESALHKQVWMLHAKGFSVREIAVRIKTRSKSPIHNIIRYIQRKAGIKK